MIYIGIYRIFFIFVLWPVLRLLALIDSKVALGWAIRKKQNKKWPWLHSTPGDRPIWIHASSMEFEYAKPVIRALKLKYPDVKIMVTFFSPSAQKSCQTFPGVDFATPSPFDCPWILKEFLNYHKPQALLLARTDTWPEMIYQCKKQNIPIVLFSSTFAEKSRRNLWGIRFFYAWLFKNITQIYTVSLQDSQNYQKLSVKAEPLGDTRFDQVFYRLRHPKPIKSHFLLTTAQMITFIAGSIWPQDEAHLIPAILALMGQPLNLRYILVPHEPTAQHLKNLKQQLPPDNVVFYSQMNSELKRQQILIVDEIGILAELYSFSQIAFVGGSFKDKVHSVMEALASGCKTMVGPYHLNNREAIEFQPNAVTKVKDAQGIQEAILSYCHMSREKQQELKNKIVSQAQAQQGATEAIVRWISHRVLRDVGARDVGASEAGDFPTSNSS